LESGGIKRALVIGVSDYHNKLESLVTAKKNADDMYQQLEVLGYEVGRSNRITGEVKWQAMRSALLDFFTDDNILINDTLLFYFSGHSVLDGFGKGYLCTSDTDPQKPFAKGISLEVTQMIDMCKSKKIVTILDCSVSGFLEK
jgi:hypothetical protein